MATAAPRSELMRGLLKALGGAGVALAVLGLVEGGLRLAGVPDPGLYAGDPAWLWTLRPDLDREVPGPGGTFRVVTSSEGFRGEGPPASGPWTLALGCSTTFGWGVEAEAAWPVRLGELLDEPVVNGGVPGWSTEQALRGLGPWLQLEPSRVVLAYIVRDAWPAPREDREAHRSPWWLGLSLARLLRGGLGGATGGHAGPARPKASDLPTTRVPPGRYAENLAALQALVERLAPEAAVVWLAFPQPEALPEWEAALARQEPALAPRLPATSFFANDPVHLDAAGHQQLASWLAGQAPFGGSAAH